MAGGHLRFRGPAAALLLLAAPPVLAGDWYDASRGCRVALQVDANGYVRFEKPVEKEMNFTAMLSALGKGGVFDPDSILVVETDASGSVVDASVPFQFDPAADYDAAGNAHGTLVFLMEGTTSAGQTRHYQVYFDAGSFPPPAVTPLVSCRDGVVDEGQESFRVETRNATYYYHKQGAGFSSMDDVDGNDWLGYRPGGGSAGEYRGIPNMGYPEGYCHPGKTMSTSTLTASGPVKVTIDSRSNDGNWAIRWEIYPYYATLTVLRVSHDYWFLYEGTPGGALDVSGDPAASDYCVRPGNVKNLVKDDWGGDLAGEEWVYFGERPDRGLGRVLFLVHHEDDGHEDSFYQMEGNMTVFGFGRVLHSTTRLMDVVPAHFTVGFCDSTDYATVRDHIYSACKPLAVSMGAPEAAGAAVGRGEVDRGIRDHKGGSSTTAAVRAVIADYRQGN